MHLDAMFVDHNSHCFSLEANVWPGASFATDKGALALPQKGDVHGATSCITKQDIRSNVGMV